MIRSVWVTSSVPLLGSTVTKSPRRASRGNDGLGGRRQVHFDDCPAIGVDEKISRHRPCAQGDAIRPSRDRTGLEDHGLGRDVKAFDPVAIRRSVECRVEDPGVGSKARPSGSTFRKTDTVPVKGFTS